MMKLILFALICIVLALQAHCAANRNKNVGDIIDEAEKELDTLRDIVKGEILVAHDDLQDLGVDFKTSVENALQKGSLAIQEEHGTIIAQVITLKELAHNAGKDSSTCTEVRERVLHRLPIDLTNQMISCARNYIQEANKLLDDSVYIIDTSINKVHHLENQLRQCEDGISCISSVLSEIQLDMVRLPQNIKTEVKAVEGLLPNLNVAFQQCVDARVSEYSSDANTILGDITACVNRLIDD